MNKQESKNNLAAALVLIILSRVNVTSFSFHCSSLIHTQAYRENSVPQAHILLEVQDVHQSFS